MNFVNEEYRGILVAFIRDLVDNGLETFLEFSPVFSAGDEVGEFEADDPVVSEAGWALGGKDGDAVDFGLVVEVAGFGVAVVEFVEVFEYSWCCWDLGDSFGDGGLCLLVVCLCVCK